MSTLRAVQNQDILGGIPPSFYTRRQNERNPTQTYYHRKLAEGKNKMLVLNAIRNKLVHRVFAVVRRGEKYDKNYTLSIA